MFSLYKPKLKSKVGSASDQAEIIIVQKMQGMSPYLLDDNLYNG